MTGEGYEGKGDVPRCTFLVRPSESPRTCSGSPTRSASCLARSKAQRGQSASTVLIRARPLLCRLYMGRGSPAPTLAALHHPSRTKETDHSRRTPFLASRTRRRRLSRWTQLAPSRRTLTWRAGRGGGEEEGATRGEARGGETGRGVGLVVFKLRRPVQSKLGRVWRAGGRPSTGNAEGFEGARAGLRIGRTSAGQSRTRRWDASHRPRPTVTSISPSSMRPTKVTLDCSADSHGTDTWTARRVEEAAGHRRGIRLPRGCSSFSLYHRPPAPFHSIILRLLAHRCSS